jgi:hypothetical protein
VAIYSVTPAASTISSKARATSLMWRLLSRRTRDECPDLGGNIEEPNLSIVGSTTIALAEA